MSEPWIIRSLGVKCPGEMYFFSYEDPPLADGYFRVDTLYTGLSAGTELTFFKGSNPYLHARWDERFGVFVPGEPSLRFPVPFIGYMEVGRVRESRTPVVGIGEMVAMTYGHKTGHTAHPAHDFFVRVPAALDPVLGIYIAQMGPICANGLLHAAVELMGPMVQHLGDGVRGRHVLVIGAGVVGLLTAVFARHHGAAEVVVADATPERLRAAEALGLRAVDTTAYDVAYWCKERWHYGHGDRGADVVFQCRGQLVSLQTALRSLRPQGTVIDLAFYQNGASVLRLGEEFHHNGLAIQAAQIGRVPRSLADRWNRRRLAAETIALLQAYGPSLRQHLITDVVPLDEAASLIADLAARRRHVLQAVFEVTP